MRISTILHHASARGVARCVGAIVIITINASVVAQGISGVFPDPVTTRDLDAFAEQLALSPQQRLGIQDAYTQYATEFRALREGAIEDYLREFGRETGFTYSRTTEVDLVKTSIRRHGEVMNRIHRLDENLFSGFPPVLADEQIARLPELRLMRQRDCHRVALERWSPFEEKGAGVDLNAIVADLELSPDVRAEIDPILQAYSRSLTSQWRSLYDEAMSAAIDVQARMDAAGIDQRPMTQEFDNYTVSTTNPEVSAMINEFNTALTRDVVALNRRTVRRLAGVLSAPLAQQVRERYCDEGFGEVPADRGRAGRLLDHLGRIDTQPDPTRQQVEQLQDRFLVSLALLVDQMIALSVAEDPEAVQFVFDDGNLSEKTTDHESRMDALRTRRDDLITRTIRELDQLLDADLRTQLDQQIAAAERDRSDKEVPSREILITYEIEDEHGKVSTFEFEVSGDGVAPGAAPGSLPNHYLPTLISPDELDRYLRRVGSSDEMREVVQTLYDDYVTRFDAFTEQRFEPLIARIRTLRQDFKPASDAPNPWADEITSIYHERRQIMDEIVAIDESLFNDLAVVLTDGELAPILERLQMARRRSLFADGYEASGFQLLGHTGASFRMGARADTEYMIDVARLVDDLDLPTDLGHTLDEMLLDYERQSTEQFGIEYESALQFSKTMDLLRAKPKAKATSEESSFSFSLEDEMLTAGVDQAESRNAIIQVNRAALARFSEVLPTESMDLLLIAYYQNAFPAIYQDPGSARGLIDAIYTLDDLSTVQSAQIDHVVAEYRASYDALCRQLAEAKLDHSAPAAASREEDARPASRRRSAQRERMQFERQNLSDRVRVELQALISEGQLEQLPAGVTTSVVD